MRRAVFAALATLLLAGCGSTTAGSDPTSSGAGRTTATAAATGAATSGATGTRTARSSTKRHRHRAHRAPIAIKVATTQYGRALVDRRGFALYLFTRDPARATTCQGACATAWPPYVVNSRPQAAQSEAHSALVATIHRPDGRLQVTYRGHPLYYYVGDRQPHQVLCQAVTEFGGTWYVVTPGGSPIQ